ALLHLSLGTALARISGQDHAARQALTNVQSTVGYIPDPIVTADMAAGIGEVLSDLRVFGEANTSLEEALTLSENRSPLVYGHGLAVQAKTAFRSADPVFAADRMIGLAHTASLVSSSWL